MAYQALGLGSSANDGTGDDIDDGARGKVSTIKVESSKLKAQEARIKAR